MNNAKLKREIIGLALLADELTDLAVFIDYSSHVSSIHIRAGKNKGEWSDYILNERFYFDFRYKSDEASYLRIKEFLEEEIEKATEIK